MTETAPAFQVPPGINLDITIGALLIGTYISVALFGFTTLQAYNYYLSYPEDRRKMKGLVVLVWVLEFIHVIFVTKAYYVLGVTNFGTFGDFIVLPFTLKFSIFWSTSIACIVQGFFANRIRIMSGRWELACVCWFLTLLRYAMAMFALGEDLQFPSQIDFDNRWQWVITVVLSSGAVNDLLIAGGLTFFLRESRSGLAKTDLIVNKIIKFTIQTGVLTSTLAILMLILYLTRPNDFIWLSVFVILARTYSNTFLATLNARNTLRYGLNKSGSTTASAGLSFSTGTGSNRADFGSGLGSGTTLQNSSMSRSGIHSKESKNKPIAIEMSSYTTADYADEAKPHSFSEV